MNDDKLGNGLLREFLAPTLNFPQGKEQKIMYQLIEKCLLTKDDEVFVDEITRRCRASTVGDIHAEVQYTALHFLSEGKRRATPIIRAAAFEEWIPAQIKAEKLIKAEAIKEGRRQVIEKVENSFTSNFEAGEGIVLYISKFEWQALKKEDEDPDEGLELRPEIIERLKRPIDKSKLLTHKQMKKKLGLEEDK